MKDLKDVNPKKDTLCQFPLFRRLKDFQIKCPLFRVSIIELYKHSLSSYWMARDSESNHDILRESVWVVYNIRVPMFESRTSTDITTDILLRTTQPAMPQSSHRHLLKLYLWRIESSVVCGYWDIRLLLPRIPHSVHSSQSHGQPFTA